MNKCLKVCFSFVAFILSTGAIVSADGTDAIVSKHNFLIGLDIGYLDYEEKGLMEEDGPMYGLIWGYTCHGDDKLMINTSLRYSFGELDYDGAYQDGTPLTADTDDWIVEGRGLIGFDYALEGSKVITPFIGIGYRYWNDDINGSGGYEREIQYWYFPVGFETISPLSADWKWGISIEYDLFLRGEVKCHISDVLPSVSDAENDQDFGDGHGIRGSLRFKGKLTKNYSLSVEPYVRYWDVDDSDTTIVMYMGEPYSIFEPANETLSFGLRLSLEFKGFLK